jgi:hypothetical protein
MKSAHLFLENDTRPGQTIPQGEQVLKGKKKRCSKLLTPSTIWEVQLKSGDN